MTQVLLDGRLSPITTSIGFLEAPLADVADALVAWRELHAPPVRRTTLGGSLEEQLCALEPLTGGARPREIAVETAGPWTAYLDCSVRGTDAVTTVGYLCGRMGVRGLAVRDVPGAKSHGSSPARFATVQLELFGPTPGRFLNYVRSIAVAQDGRSWVFVAEGDPQPFEDISAYGRRRVADRFTSAMLDEYCSALGVRLNDEGYYGPRAVLVESSEPLAVGGVIMTIAEARHWLGYER